MRRSFAMNLLVAIAVVGLLAGNAAALTLTGSVKIPQAVGDFVSNLVDRGTFYVATEAVPASGLPLALSAVNGTDGAMCFQSDTSLSPTTQLTLSLAGGQFNFTTSQTVALVVPSAANVGSTTNATSLATTTQSSTTSSLNFTLTSTLNPSTTACFYVQPTSGNLFSLPDILVSQNPTGNKVTFTVSQASNASSAPVNYATLVPQLYKADAATAPGSFVQSLAGNGTFYTSSNITLGAQIAVRTNGVGDNTTPFKQKVYTSADNSFSTASPGSVMITVSGDMTPFNAVYFDATGTGVTTSSTALTINTAKTQATKTINSGTISFSNSTTVKNFLFTPNQSQNVTAVGPYTITMAITPTTTGASPETFTWSNVIQPQTTYLHIVDPYFNMDSTNFYTYIQLVNNSGKSANIFAKATDRSGNIYFGKLSTSLLAYGPTVILATDLASALPALPAGLPISLELFLAGTPNGTTTNPITPPSSTTGDPGDSSKILATSHMRTLNGGAERTIPISVETVTGLSTSTNLR